jgi:segregation and condensation protein B
LAKIARLFPDSTAETAPEPEIVLDPADAARLEAHREGVRIAEALLFAATQPLEESDIAKQLPEGVKTLAVLEELREHYAGRGVNLARVAKKWFFRTATDLGWLLARDQQEQKKLSRAALETLSIIAYHQPVTRAEIEDIRGVAISRGTVDALIESGWVRLRGRRKAPGRPVTYGTTDTFLIHFGLEAITDLPGLDELKGAGLFDGRLPPGFGVPTPSDDPALTADEDPLEGDLFDDLPLESAIDTPELAEAGVEAIAAAFNALQMVAEAEAAAEAEALVNDERDREA